MMSTKGKVYLLGAGPGRPDLITLRGWNILKEADVIIYDYLVNPQILRYAKADAEFIDCKKMVIDKETQTESSQVRTLSEKRQKAINNIMLKKAKEGKRVVRLKNGDPMIFGRCSQELEILNREGIEFEIVPGVTSASAAGAYTGIPLSDRRYASSCVFITGKEDPKKDRSQLDWNAISKIGTIVLYMAVKNLEDVVHKLLGAGRKEDTPVAIVQEAGSITQKTLTGTLGNITKIARLNKLTSPAIVIIGEVARLENRFNWFKKNKKILFTGISQERFFLKGTYFHIPLIKILPMSDYSEFDSYLKDVRRFDWTIFCSRYGVEFFFNRLFSLGFDTRILNGVSIAAIGSSTAGKLREYGIIADLVPKKECSKGLLLEFKSILDRYRHQNRYPLRIFLPRSDISDKGLEKGLKALGAQVVTAFAYRNVIPEDLPNLNLDYFDKIIFTSPSTVRSFVKRYGRNIPKHTRIDYIGEVTKQEVKRQRLISRLYNS